MISLIIPVRGEEPGFADRLAPWRDEMEILIADGGSPERQRNELRALGSRILVLPGASRGKRLAAAAEAASGEVLLFVHADSELPADARRLVQNAVSSGAEAGCFRLAYDETSWAIRFIAFWANVRTRLAQLPFGDQGVFCTRRLYERAGGFRDLPICDDLDFVRRLRRLAKIHVLPADCRTSARRLARGPFRQTLRNWRVMAGYYAGVSPARLERWYRS